MSDEVSHFLQQVERLRGQQIEDDQVRARELEEFLAAKRQRQARREERARSISPQKSSPLNTPSPRSNTRSLHDASVNSIKIESPTPPGPLSTRRSLPPPPPPPLLDSPSLLSTSASSAKENEAPASNLNPDRPSPPSSPVKSSPLSWQRRPNSRAAGSRPLTILAAQNATQRSLAGHQDPVSTTDSSVFTSDIPPSSPTSSDQSFISSLVNNRRPHFPSDHRPSSESTPEIESPSRSSLGSPPQLMPHRPGALNDSQLPPHRRQSEAVPADVAASLVSTSPTKGLGGFVQSAMMKRTDSVKRWSVNSPPGLARADSVASNRTLSNQRRSYQLTSPPSSSASFVDSTTSSSRPNLDPPETKHLEAKPPRQASGNADNDEAAKSTTSTTPPHSPSKSLDSRRWSPAKSSWLESALNKPDSPRPSLRPSPSQPAWMAELNKSKAERSHKPSAGTPSPSSVLPKHQVSIGGLMRQSSMGSVAKPNTKGLGGIYSPPPAARSLATTLPTKADDTSPPPAAAASNMVSGPLEDRASEEARPRLSEASITKTNVRPAPRSEVEAAASGPAADSLPPRKNSASYGPTHRPAVQKPAGTAEVPEFKNVFGNLRKTRTQNYVAPDELKNNILRGKAALNATGGPRKSERKDEFKEAILKKREDFKRAQQEGRGVSRQQPVSTTAAAAHQAPLPEGLAKRAELSRSATVAKKGHRVADFEPPGRTQRAGSDGLILNSPQSSALSSASGRDSPKAESAPMTTASNKPDLDTPPGQTSGGRGVRAETETNQQAGRDSQPEPEGPRASAGKERSGTLSDRFKPALAAMLAKGPPLMASKSSPGPEEQSRQPESTVKAPSEAMAPGPRLKHMTKDRARGPRRRAPAGTETPAQAAVVGPRVVPSDEEAGLSAGASTGSQDKKGEPRESRPPTDSRSSSKQDSAAVTDSSSSKQASAAATDSSSSKQASAAAPSTKRTNEASALLMDFFGPLGPRKAVQVDVAELVMQQPETEAKVASTGHRIFRLTKDGSKEAVSAEEERLLFEDEIYLCIHHFVSASGQAEAEVYLWRGDGVSAARAEAGLELGRREARAAGGPLVELRQGKESARFVQAVGGVIMVRRGPQEGHAERAPYMLCGRRYLGQVAFDEVDLAPSSLCSGFVYLVVVSRPAGCFLWKGKGSDVAEVSCARLIGTDLAPPGGELVEYDDGAEPDSFWAHVGSAAPAPSRLHSADHWRLKPNHDKYGSRLFCVDAESSPQQIVEIRPFSQADLSPAHIYLLDAFFELYLVVGARAGSQYSSFRGALDFAQEYGILAAGMQDRPFVPVATVVLEGIPRDLRPVFRKWQHAHCPTLRHPWSSSSSSSSSTATSTASSASSFGSEGTAAAAAALPSSPLSSNSPSDASLPRPCSSSSVPGPDAKRGHRLRVLSLNQALQALGD